MGWPHSITTSSPSSALSWPLSLKFGRVKPLNVSKDLYHIKDKITHTLDSLIAEFQKFFEVACDASSLTFNGILSQDNKN